MSTLTEEGRARAEQEERDYADAMHAHRLAELDAQVAEAEQQREAQRQASAAAAFEQQERLQRLEQLRSERLAERDDREAELRARQQAEVAAASSARSSVPLCACGTFAVGVCTQCGKACCPQHSVTVDDRRLCMDDLRRLEADPEQANLLRMRRAPMVPGDDYANIIVTAAVQIDLSPGLLAVTPNAVGLYKEKFFGGVEAYKPTWISWHEIVDCSWQSSGSRRRLHITHLHKALGAWKLSESPVTVQKPLFVPAAELALEAWRATRQG